MIFRVFTKIPAGRVLRSNPLDLRNDQKVEILKIAISRQNAEIPANFQRIIFHRTGSEFLSGR
jgi:hypothetical protein